MSPFQSSSEHQTPSVHRVLWFPCSFTNFIYSAHWEQHCATPLRHEAAGKLNTLLVLVCFVASSVMSLVFAVFCACWIHSTHQLEILLQLKSWRICLKVQHVWPRQKQPTESGSNGGHSGGVSRSSAAATFLLRRVRVMFWVTDWLNLRTVVFLDGENLNGDSFLLPAVVSAQSGTERLFSAAWPSVVTLTCWVFTLHR